MKVYCTYTDPADEEAAHLAYCKAHDLGWDFGNTYASKKVYSNDEADRLPDELRALGFTVKDVLVDE